MNFGNSTQDSPASMFQAVKKNETTENQTYPISYTVFSEAQQNTEPNFYLSRQIFYSSLYNEAALFLR